MSKFLTENNILRTFEISIILKGIHAVLEIIGGVTIYFTSKAYLLTLVASVTRDELVEGKNDFIAEYLIKSANNFSIDSQHFVSLYLLSHGVIKLLLVVGLLKRKLWAYQSAIAAFSFFIIY